MINVCVINVLITVSFIYLIINTPVHYCSHIPPEAGMSTTEMILYHGYPVQVFDAYTADGYVLRLHRIPFGKNGNFTHRDPNSPVIYLQHGLLGSSGDWVENLPNESFDFFFKIILNVSLILSFILADAGFDVWLGNSRGNSYSIRHVNYSIDDELFWKFSWYEMAKYDLDATFDLILKETGQDSLYYVGFSQGTLIMFTKLADDPIFATKIRKFFALGPIGTVAHVRGLLQILATRIFRDKRVAIHFFGTKYFMLNSKLSKILSILICGTRFFNPLCSSILFQLSGPESNQFNESRLPVYVAGEGGTSVMNILHWIQMVNSGKLQAYSYDSVKENQKYYGQDSAPIYDLSSINASIYLFWSKEDWLANPIDIQNSLLSVLPNNSIRGNYKLNKFGHLDFIWGLRAPTEIYHRITSIIQEDSMIIL